MGLRFVSLLGLLTMLAVAWGCSLNRRRFPWRVVAWGLALQFSLALVLLHTQGGRALFDTAGKAVRALTAYADEGSRFVFGPLADAALLDRVFGGRGLIFAVMVTGTIILVSSLSAVLYHWGLLQQVVRTMAWLMRRLMGTSGAETLSAAANVFMGQTEAPLLVRPYIAQMTRSELLCLMTGGMATIAGGVAAVYARMGAEAGHPDMAGHLLTASVMNAPAALVMAKILLPETETSVTTNGHLVDPPRLSVNSLDALCQGAADGLRLSLNVLAMLIAFVAVVALVNGSLELMQRWLGVTEPVTLQEVLGWLNAPFAWLLGTPLQDCWTVGQILGERIVLNEFIGYSTLTRPDTVLTERAFVLTTYALCGFANVTSIAIQVGGIGSLAPERRAEMARLGVRAMLGGVLATYSTACVVGVLL
ncbi:MAG: nucleoside transporter C-terminal domain-containing protein [Verrucomicrobiota bacterium]|nr:nucleoside transporter C-terminal domain-containing protein [Verrucomicrobiota bacterium]